jgi:hypothetical protein
VLLGGFNTIAFLGVGGGFFSVFGTSEKRHKWGVRVEKERRGV